MILTEAEARTKWCPFARVIDYVEYRDGEVFPPINRDNPRDGKAIPAGGTQCLGSGCMAWRWIEQGSDSESIGFCGLAGRPT